MFLYWIHHKPCSEHRTVCIAATFPGSIALSAFNYQACSEECVPMPSSPFASGTLFYLMFSHVTSQACPQTPPWNPCGSSTALPWFSWVSPCLLRMVPFSQHFPTHRITAGTRWDSTSTFLSTVWQQPHQSCLFDIILLLTKCLKAMTISWATVETQYILTS